MTVINGDDVRRQLEAAGLLLDGEMLVGTTKPVRVRVSNEGREKRGWYRLYELPTAARDSVIGGSYGIWHGADSGAKRIDWDPQLRERLSVEQRIAAKARYKADRDAAAAELARQHQRASARATRAWAQMLPVAAESEYLSRKGLTPGKLYGARVSKGGNLVVPISDDRGTIWGLQVIWSDPKVKARKQRDKEYWPAGLAKQGHWAMIGSAGRGSVILVCEGFATGASLHEATGLPVVVAFDAGNMLPVVQRIDRAYRGTRILACADDDWLQRCRACGKLTPVADARCAHCGEEHGAANPGVTAASTAAMAVGGAWVKPDFPAQRPADRKGATDFNDLHQAAGGGLHLVARQIEAAIAAKGWPAAQGARPVFSNQGTGGSGRPGAQAIMALTDLVARFVPIDDGTGEYLFDLWANRVVRTKQAVALLPAGGRWDDVKRHPVWISRGAYYLDQVGFDPSGADPAVALNTWRGWLMQPKAGSCARMLELIRYLCGEDNGDAVYRYLMRWLAYPLQRPGAKMHSAVIMHGPQGTGKTTVFKAIADIYGEYSYVLDQRGLEDRFNSDWADRKLFILAEEVVTRAEMWQIKNELKELVTGEWIRVNPKNIAAYRQRNRVNIVYLSNEGQPMPLDNDDRRHLVIWTPPALDEATYDAVHMEIENGGREALFDHLLNLDLGDFHPKKRPPVTAARHELITVSLTSEARFLTDWCDGDLGLPVLPCRSTDLYAAYLRWCRDNGESRPRPSNQFFNHVHRREGWAKRKARLYVGSAAVTAPIIFPPTDLLERAGNAQPDQQTEARWLADTVARFADAMKNPSEGGECAF